MGNCYFNYVSAYNWKTGECYPELAFNGYTKAEIKKRYREQFGLVGKHNIEFIWA